MKLFQALFLLALTAASAHVISPAFAAGDCILDNCADRQKPQPAPQAAPDSPAPNDQPPARKPWFNTRGGAAPSGNFDFYVLSLSWSPSFCAGGGASRSGAQCAPGANPGFVVHGLWPQFSSGYPSQCGGDGYVPYPVLNSLRGLYPDLGLAKHEWRTHGVCSGKNAAGYFDDVRAARDGLAIPPALKAPGQDQTVAPLEIQRAFIAANPRLRPGMMAVTCRGGRFQEARFCLSKDLRDFVDCPQVVREGCFSQSMIVPAAQ
jgi:ribonuclease T2